HAPTRRQAKPSSAMTATFPSNMRKVSGRIGILTASWLPVVLLVALGADLTWPCGGAVGRGPGAADSMNPPLTARKALLPRLGVAAALPHAPISNSSGEPI